MSFLSALGNDIKKVFSWVSSPGGQAKIVGGETIVEAVFPALTGIITLANTWFAETVKTEALATAAGQQNGTGAQKAAAVLNVMTPEVLAFTSAHKMPIPSQATILLANTKLVEFLNLFGAPGTASTPSGVQPVAPIVPAVA